MIESSLNNVSSPFEMLLEEVEAEIDFVNGVGSKAFEGGDYDKATEALERSGTLTAFRDRVAALRKGREEMAAAAERDEDQETRARRRNLGKLRKGVRTPDRPTTGPPSRCWTRWAAAARWPKCSAASARS